MGRNKKKPQRPGFGDAISVIEQVLPKYQVHLPPDGYQKLLEELKKPLLPAIRLNPLKIEDNHIIENWKDKYGWEVKEIPFCASGFWVEHFDTPPGKTLEHRLGYYYIQDAASMLPVTLFDIDASAAPLILDMAASPGGKTTHLISRTLDRGLVIANDTSRERLTPLRLALQGWGAAHWCATNFAGEQFGNWYTNLFDFVLLDAPCSGENLRPSAAHPMRFISDRERQALSVRQYHLLESALMALKPGGQVVYSTCTLSPEEDEAVLEKVLKSFPWASMESSKYFPDSTKGLISDGQNRYDPSIEKAIRLWPHCFGTSGFFAALLKKNDSINSKKDIDSLPPERNFEKSGFYLLNPLEFKSVYDYFGVILGFNLRQWVEQECLALYGRENMVYALPETYFEKFATLPVYAIGLPVAERTPDGLLPSHEWVTRFGLRVTESVVILEQKYVQGWMRGEDMRDIIMPETLNNASFVIVKSDTGDLLGRGKWSINNQRLKNLLPRRIVFG